MLRFIAPAVVIVFSIGCRAPAPTFNIFAPGATRIPPPATKSYGSADNYYQGPTVTSPPVGTGVKSSRPNRTQLSQADTPKIAADSSSDSSASSPVRTVSISSSVVPSRTDSASGEQPRIRIVNAESVRSTSATKTQGMPVSDLTVPDEPRPLSPPERVVDISQLPKTASSGRSSFEPRQITSSATAKPANAEKQGPTVRNKTTWQPRESWNDSVRIAGR